MPSGVYRLRASLKLKNAARDAERDAPRAVPRKTLKTSNKSPNPRVGALGDHEDVNAPVYDPETHGSYERNDYSPCCPAGHDHAGPHVYQAKERRAWLKSQATEQERASRAAR